MFSVPCAGLVQRAAGRLLAAQQAQQQAAGAQAKLLLSCLVKARQAAAQANPDCLQIFQVRPLGLVEDLYMDCTGYANCPCCTCFATGCCMHVERGLHVC